MSDYPICLDIRDRACLVVGGGAVAGRKVRGLLDRGARVRVISPAIRPELKALVQNSRIQWEARPYRSGDAQGVFLAFAATDQPEVNQEVACDARAHGVLCNLADNRENSDFTLPAVVRQGPLQVAISTAGTSPGLARRIRKELQGRFGPEYRRFLTLMGRIRHRLLERETDPQGHKTLFDRLLDSELLERIQAEDIPAIDQILLDILGSGFTFESLMENDRN